MKNIKQNLKKNKKVLNMISIVLIIYIFVLVIGYSFFRESLKISGNVSTDQPKDCPFEVQDIAPLYTLQSGNSWMSIYNANHSEMTQLSKLVLPVLSNIPMAFMTHPFGFYDNNIDTLSFVINKLWLYNTTSSNATMGGIDRNPMYFVFKNTSARSLSDFKIKVDYDNQVGSSHEPPLELFDIRYMVISDINDIKGITEADALNENKPSAWNDMQSAFKNSSLQSVSYFDSNYYYYDEFQEGAEIQFKTEPIGTNEYLVLGFQLPQRHDTSKEEVDANWKNYYMTFKFWPSTFSEESAFHVRMKFDDGTELNNYGTQIVDTLGGGSKTVQDVYKEFLANPSLVPSPWWN